MIDDFVIIDENTKLEDEVIGEYMYYDLFVKLGEKKSKKMVHYLIAKVLTFANDYDNPERVKHMDKLKMLKPHYKRAFNKDFI